MLNPLTKIPFAIKFYKCRECLNEMLFPIYDFTEIASIKNSNYKGFCQLFHKMYPLANLGKLLKNCLWNYIKINPACESKSLKTIAIPNIFIETPIPSIIIEPLSKLYDLDNPIRWLFELLTIDRFIEIG